MKISVLAVGPGDIKKLVLDVAKEYPEIHIDYADYADESRIVDAVRENEKDYDILLFAGSLPYTIAKEKMHLEKPMFYIQFEGTALYRVLFHLNNKKINNGLFTKHVNISIDNMQQFEVEECFEELDLKVQHLFIYNNNQEQDTEEIIKYHQQLWENKKIDVAITSVGSVYKRLKKLGVCTARIKPTRIAIRSSLQRVLLEGKNLRQYDSQIAVGIIDLSNMYELKPLSEYQFQRRILAMQTILIDYGERSQSIVKWPEGEEVKFITTRGALQFKNNESKELALLKEIFNKTEVEASLGIGIGETANRAEFNAREALKKAAESKSSFFVVDMDGKVRAPVGNKIQLTYSMRNENVEISQMAKKAKISSATINRIISFCEVQGKSNMTTAELASGLGITSRSARRILNKLEEVHLASVTGEEQPIYRGRPRQIYSLSFVNQRKV